MHQKGVLYKMKTSKRYFIFLLALMLIISSVPVSAASSLKIKRSGKSMTYKGKQIKVVYNGKNIPITSTPAITLDKYNMIPYYYVFYKNGPKMKYSYSNNKSCITLTYQNTTVKLYNKKKTAYVNGVKKTLPVAPCFVTFVKSNKKVFMIPAKPVCQYFGFTYSYSSSKKTITITNPNKVTVSSGSSSSVSSQSNASKKTAATQFKSMTTSQFIKKVGPIAQARQGVRCYGFCYSGSGYFGERMGQIRFGSKSQQHVRNENKLIRQYMERICLGRQKQVHKENR